MYCAQLERYNRTLKTRLEKYMYSKETLKYIDVLPKNVAGINATVTRGIGMSPEERDSVKKESKVNDYPKQRMGALKRGDIERIASRGGVISKRL